MEAAEDKLDVVVHEYARVRAILSKRMVPTVETETATATDLLRYSVKLHTDADLLRYAITLYGAISDCCADLVEVWRQRARKAAR